MCEVGGDASYALLFAQCSLHYVFHAGGAFRGVEWCLKWGGATYALLFAQGLLVFEISG